MSKQEIEQMKGVLAERGSRQRRRRLTDHEKTIQVLQATQPIIVQSLGVVRDLVSIPAVGIGVTWWGMNVFRTFWNLNRPQSQHIDTHMIEGALGAALVAAAVVPAAKTFADMFGGLLGGLFGGSAAGGGSPLG
mgnify:CR=1 FL=1